MQKNHEPMSLGRAIGLGLPVAVIVQFFLLVGMGFHTPGGSDSPPIVVAAGAYYAVNILILGLVVHGLEWHPFRRAPRMTIRSALLLVAVCAANLIFLRHWADHDAVVRRTVDIEYVRSWNVGVVVIPLEFLLSVFNSSCLLLALSRAEADRTRVEESSDEV